MGRRYHRWREMLWAMTWWLLLVHATPVATPGVVGEPRTTHAVELQGRVIGPDGRPVASARLSAIAGPALAEPIPSVVARTTTEGFFRLRLPTAGPWQLSLREPGARRSWHSRWEVYLTDLSLPILRLPAHDGAPATEDSGPGTFWRLAASSADGDPEADHPRPGDLDRATTRPPRRGILVDATTGEPIEGGWIWAPEGDGSASRSDAVGHFVLPPSVGTRDGAREEIRMVAAGHRPRVLERGRFPTTGDPVLVPLSAARPATGRVFDQADHPVADVEIRLLHPEHPPQSAVTVWTNSQGSFFVPHLDAGVYDLDLRPTDHAPLVIPGLEVRPDPPLTDLGSIWLGNGDRLSGRTLDPEGRAIAGVGITAWPTGPDGLRAGPTEPDERRETLSDHDGHFVLTALSPGERWLVRAQKAGWGTTFLDQVRPRDAEDILLELNPEAVLEGEVREASGQAVAGVVLRLLPGPERVAGRSSEALGVATTSDAEGHFHLGGIAPGRHRLELRAASSRGHELLQETMVELTAGEHRQLDLRLELGVELSGRVSDAEGLPLADVWVVVETGDEGEPPRARTDDSGEFRLVDIPRGSWRLVAWHPAYPVEVRELVIEPHVTPPELELVLDTEQGFSLSGAVVETVDDRPIAGVRLSLADTTGRALHPPVTTDDDGRFRFGEVRNGDYLLRARRPAGAAEASWPLTVAGDDLDELRLAMPAAARLEGRLLGADLQTLQNIVIEARGEHRVPSGRPDHEGRFTFEGLAPGSWRIVARSPGDGRTAAETVELGSGETTRVELDLANGIELEGIVRADGEPVAGASVELLGADTRPTTRTDHLGSYRLVAPEQGSYRLRVVVPAMGLETVESIDVPPAGAIDIELETTVLEGRVVLAEDGSPVGGAQIVLEAADAHPIPPRRATSDLDGRFSLSGLGDGSYRLTADSGDRRAIREVSIPAAEPALLRLERESEVRLFVVGTAARPSIVDLVALGPEGQRLAGRFGLDDQGSIALSLPSAGRLRLLLSAPGHASVETPWQGEASLTIGLPPAASLDIEPAEPGLPPAMLVLVDSEGRRFVRVEPGGNMVDTWPFPAGRRSFRLTGLPPGSWRAQAITGPGDRWAGEAWVAAGGRATIFLTPEP